MPIYEQYIKRCATCLNWGFILSSKGPEVPQLTQIPKLDPILSSSLQIQTQDSDHDNLLKLKTNPSWALIMYHNFWFLKEKENRPRGSNHFLKRKLLLLHQPFHQIWQQVTTEKTKELGRRISIEEIFRGKI